MLDREQLEADLENIRVLNDREATLLSELDYVRRLRASYDAAIAKAVAKAEGQEHTPEQWQAAVGGIEAELSKALGRHALREQS